jgi:hypothetical protein
MHSRSPISSTDNRSSASCVIEQSLFQQLVSESRLWILGEEIMAGGWVTPPHDRLRSLSPVPRRLRHSDREVVIECMVEKASTSIIYPIITRTNYSEWALVMQVL